MELSASIQYSIIIPVYNSTQVLVELQQKIDYIFSVQINQSYEIILVDDGSSNPGTWPCIEKLVQNNEHISAISLTRNFGQHAALLCGMAHAKGAYVITMDDDLQHSPEDIPALIRLQEHDVVMGQFHQKKHSLLRNLASGIKAYFDRVISGKPRNLRVSTFCLIRRSIAEQMLAIIQTPHPLFSSLIFQVTLDVVGVPVSHSPRQEGKSGYSFIRLIKLFGRLFMNNSKLIFQSVAWSGALLSGISLAILFSLLVMKDVPGLLFLGMGILISEGLLLLALGIRGISLSRIKAGEQQKIYLIKQRISYS